ncbi:PaaX family transcriptional regulator C-terminal domain-containing protein [Pacificoceanicola onchidii]|uniref:PaaX family transcriptional regulator C-terminal domain-containing protein n=1 Tax=Pacificoceanicola onchidii TaxID=2562685 RepID=UPI0010A664BB|nr:PaaX family transcriptional regulator C-terminal domain-containing protein [Pacificoceanicola onchidii]
MPQPMPQIAEEIALFEGLGPLRTWSVIVTIMGDTLRGAGQGIGGKELAARVGAIGITDQALRVAVHRLKKDGWIESRRDGRSSVHFLTASARRETEAVRPLIYSVQPPEIGPVSLVVSPPDLAAPLAQSLPPGRSVQLTSRSGLISGAVPEGAYLTTPLAGTLPDWVCQSIASTAHRAACKALTQATLEGMERCPDDPEKRAALRLLILHHWRRLVLRQSPLADALLGEDWEGAVTRRTVHAALDSL